MKSFAADPLVTIGAHTVSHCNLAKRSEPQALDEITVSRTRIEATLQRPVVHLAYPYGDRCAAGPREFAMTQAAGFNTAVTTRPCMIFPEMRSIRRRCREFLSTGIIRPPAFFPC